MRILAVLALLLAGIEKWATYACSQAPIDGLAMAEVNPVSAWLLEAIGPPAAPAVDALVTLAVVVFLLRTRLLPGTARAGLLLAVAALTAAGAGATLGRVAALSLF